jgi:hypothetical protein
VGGPRDTRELTRPVAACGGGSLGCMPWDDDDDWEELKDDPESVERRRQAMLEVRRAREKALRYGYGVLGILVIVVIVLALTR